MTPNDNCPDCGHPAAQPYRRRNSDGILIEGCVSSFHNASADAWHNRPEAQELRDNEPRPLIKCKRCEQYTNPEPKREYVRKRTGCQLPGRVLRLNEETKVCEYCGWKVTQ